MFNTNNDDDESQNKFIHNKNLGQHFLIDQTYINNIYKTIDMNYLTNTISNSSTNNNIIEIGPGLGILTKYIYNKQFQNLKIIEKDYRLIEQLRKQYPKATVIHNDCLKENLKSDIIITNLPYNISNNFLIYIASNDDFGKTILVMLQRELATKLISEKNYLSVFLRIIFNINLCFNIPNAAFEPRPKVHSSFLCLKRKLHNITNVTNLFNFIKKLFNKKNQKIKNIFNLTSLNLQDYEDFNEIICKRPMHLSEKEILDLYFLIKN